MHRKTPLSRTLAVMVTLVLVVVALVGCSSKQQTASESSPKTETAPKETLGTKEKPLKIGIGRIGLFMAGYDIKPLLEKEGIYVELIEFAATPERMAALLGGSIDMTYAGWVDTLKLASKGDPIVVVADASRKGVAIVAKADSNIKSVADLKGKKVAISKGSMQEMSIIAEFEQIKLDANKDAELLQMRFPDMPVALSKGDIDAFVGTEPYPSMALAGGYARLVSYPYDVPWGNLNANLITTHDFLPKHRDLVKKVVAAHVKVTKDLANDPARQKSLAVNEFKIPADAVDIFLNNVTFESNLHVPGIEAFAKYQQKVGYIKDLPDFNKLLDTSILAEVSK